MAYSVPIGTPHPGCFVILVDQSASMNGLWQSGTKAKAAALIVSRTIHELGLSCDTESGIKDRCHLHVIRYGDEVDCVAEGPISHVYTSPIATELVTKSIPDGAGGKIEIEAEVPIWLRPRASGGTPMDEAFERAAAVIQQWCLKWPNNFPPVVINITDGDANNPDSTADAAAGVMDMHTADGNVLVYNVHIANSGNEVTFPHDTMPFANDRFARFLFGISSVLPEVLRFQLPSIGLSAQPNARCLAYNATEPTLLKILEFGTVLVLQPPSEENL